jgi:hypothetical protein
MTLQHACLQAASEAYGNELPNQDLWEGMTEEDQQDWLTSNCRESLDGLSGDAIYNLIDCHADTILRVVNQFTTGEQ